MKAAAQAAANPSTPACTEPRTHTHPHPHYPPALVPTDTSTSMLALPLRSARQAPRWNVQPTTNCAAGRGVRVGAVPSVQFQARAVSLHSASCRRYAPALGAWRVLSGPSLRHAALHQLPRHYTDSHICRSKNANSHSCQKATAPAGRRAPARGWPAGRPPAPPA